MNRVIRLDFDIECDDLVGLLDEYLPMYSVTMYGAENLDGEFVLRIDEVTSEFGETISASKLSTSALKTIKEEGYRRFERGQFSEVE